MSYSANDHAGDTLSLVIEVIDEAIEQTESEEAEMRLQELQQDAHTIRGLIIEQEGETPTQKLMDALEKRND